MSFLVDPGFGAEHERAVGYEVFEWYVERLGDEIRLADGGAAGAAFDVGDGGAADVGVTGELLLCDAPVAAGGCDAGGEPAVMLGKATSLGGHCRILGHAGDVLRGRVDDGCGVRG